MCGPLFAKTTAAQVPVDGGNDARDLSGTAGPITSRAAIFRPTRFCVARRARIWVRWKLMRAFSERSGWRGFTHGGVTFCSRPVCVCFCAAYLYSGVRVCASFRACARLSPPASPFAVSMVWQAGRATEASSPVLQIGTRRGCPDQLLLASRPFTSFSSASVMPCCGRHSVPAFSPTFSVTASPADTSGSSCFCMLAMELPRLCRAAARYVPDSPARITGLLCPGFRNLNSSSGQIRELGSEREIDMALQLSRSRR